MTVEATNLSVHQNPPAEPPARRNVWQFLTEPSAQIRQPEHRRRARMLSAILIVFVPLGILFIIISTINATTPPLQDPGYYVLFFGSLIAFVAYLLSRTTRYALAALLLIATFTLTILSTLLISPVARLSGLAPYMVTGVFIGSLLLSLRTTAIAGLFSVAALLLLPVLSPDRAFLDILDSLSFLIITLVVVLLGSSIRTRDLEQLEQQSKELSKALEEAEVANRLKSQFLATMSHELRTPLNAVVGYAELMQLGLSGKLDSDAVRTTERIYENGRRLLGLIDDILDISKIEAGRTDVIRRPFEPADVLEDLERTMRPAAKKKDVAFNTVLDPNLPRVLVGDRKRLEQILLNLASNAVKFTEEGSVTVDFKQTSQSTWSISVTDTGIGIPSHAQEYIFEKFRQVDSTTRRAYGGAGLGLAIVRELTLLMDGNIKVNSQENVGSTFTISLPIVLPERDLA